MSGFEYADRDKPGDLSKVLYFTDEAMEHGDGPTGWCRESDGSRRYVIDGVTVDREAFFERFGECDGG